MYKILKIYKHYKDKFNKLFSKQKPQWYYFVISEKIKLKDSIPDLSNQGIQVIDFKYDYRYCPKYLLIEKKRSFVKNYHKKHLDIEIINDNVLKNIKRIDKEYDRTIRLKKLFN